MKCESCELATICEDPAQAGGGCDMDCVDDFGSGDDFEIEEEARAEYYELLGDIERDESEARDDETAALPLPSFLLNDGN